MDGRLLSAKVKTVLSISPFEFLTSALLLFSAFCLFPTQATEAQIQRQQFILQHEVKVTLKLIQVYVTDKKGNPISDLNNEKFSVDDNGKKQNLTEFEKHFISVPAEIEEKMTATPLTLGRQLMPRRFFLFFDFAFNNAKGIEKAKKAALHFIDAHLMPTDEVGVISCSAIKALTIHEYLTLDHERVRTMVREIGIKEIAGRTEDFEEEYWSLIKEDNPRDAAKRGYVFDPWEERQKELEFLAKTRETSQLQAYTFVKRMSDMAKALRYIPGHKSIIFFSSGVPYSIVTGKYWRPHEEKDYARMYEPTEGFRSHLSLIFEDMLKELSAANCTIYALDTYDPSTAVGSDFQARGAFSLQKMTSETGGKYFGNINNYEQHIEKIQKMTGCYYVLGYYVDDQWDGKYHEIKVEVDRPGCKVYAQKGYFNPKPFKEYSDLERMLHLVDLALSETPLFQTPLRFPLIALPYSTPGKQNLSLWARVEKEKIQQMEGKKLEAVTLFFDEQDNIVKMERREVGLAALAEGPLYFYSSFSLPAGAYKCRLVLRNLESGRGAVASSSILIPELQTDRLQPFPPLLLKEEENGFYVQVSRRRVEFPFDRTKYAPLLEDLQAGTPCLYENQKGTLVCVPY